MRKLLTIFLLLASSICFSQGRRIYVEPPGMGQAGKVIDKWFAGSILKQQDTLVIRSTDGYRHGYIQLEYVYGTVDGTRNGTMDVTKPIVIINEGTDTTWVGAFGLTGCRNIKITGTGSSSINYGFAGGEGFAGFSLDGMTSNVEVEKCFGKNSLYVIQAKQDNRCPDSATSASVTPYGDSLNYAGHFHMDHIYFHNNRWENCGADGEYLGNTEPTEGYGTGCAFVHSGGTILYNSPPMRLSNFHFSYDTLIHCGRTWIQLSGADSGHNEIDHNYTYGSGYEINNQQGASYITGGCSDSTYVHDNTFICSYQENVVFFGMGAHDRPGILDHNYIDSAGVLPFTVYDKLTITNTDTAYARVHCYYDNIDPSVTKIVIYETKGSGTTNSYAYVVGIPFAGEAKIFDTAQETHMNAYVACSDTFNFSNVSSQNHQFSITGNFQFLRVIIKQSGTQVNTYRCYVNNAQYNFGIGVDDKITFPARLPVTIWIRNNTFGLTDSIRGGHDIVTGDAQLSATGFSAYTDSSRFCSNLRTSGTQATIQNNGNINYSTNCNGANSVVVSVSGNQTITLPTTSATVSGSATSSNGSITAYAWTQNPGGPNTATITSPTATSTTVTGLVQGTYSFRLTATDVASETGFKNTTIIVHGQPGKNIYVRAITIDHTKVDSLDEKDFPILISGTLSYLKTEANGGKVKNANGYDIRFFSDSLCADKLDYEVEHYVATTGEIEAWVKIDSLTAITDKIIYMGYGDSTITLSGSSSSTWSNGYAGVYHLKDGTTLSVSDATINGFNGTNHSATATTGEIDGGMALSGSSQYVDLGNNFGITSDMTISAWVHPTNFSSESGIVSKTNSNQPQPYDYKIWNSSGLPTFFRGDGTGSNDHFDATNPLTAGIWSYVSVTVTAAQVSHYLNGELNGTHGLGTGGNPGNGTAHAYIGTRGDFGTMFNGVIDEVHVANVSRTSFWVKTEYNSQSSPSTFYSIGAEKNNTIIAKDRSRYFLKKPAIHHRFKN